MFSQQHELSVVTAVLPSTIAEHVIEVLHAQSHRAMLVWKARGTTVRDRWYARWLPPISPVKVMLRLVVPQSDVDAVLATIVTEGRLHMQATGAVFAMRCEAAFRGNAFACPGDNYTTGGTDAEQPAQSLQHNLRLLSCVVAHQYSERVARAAIEGGAHGPIVHYVEGRGLRDRLGWLRITKEQEKEVLMVIADEEDSEEIFDRMANVGEFHLPGRGIMYSMEIDKGMFNLPGLISHHHHAASMQQIINAIDHLQGHAHWRDQSVFDVGAGGRGSGMKINAPRRGVDNQLSLNAVVRRDDMDELMGVMLNAGAPGVSIHYSRIAEPREERVSAASPARVSREYAHLRGVTDRFTAERICQALEAASSPGKLDDVFAYTTAVPRVAMYVPGKRNYRKAS
ncbi:MAG: hypothetical protein AAGA68_24885 [Pseudomonadota bacterium]